MSDNKTRRAPQFDPESDKPFRISRSKFDLFLRCPLCFYLNQRLSAKISDDRYFGLNIRIDGLLKKDADRLRLNQQPDPRAKKFGINAIPFNHPDIKKWLDIFNKGKYDGGIEHLHTKTNLIVCGAPDDVWLVDGTTLSIIDVKATNSNKPIEESFFWKENKRQVDLYSWILSKQGLHYPVSKTSYFIRINTDKTQDSFENNQLEFNYEVITHAGSYRWIEPTLERLKACLMQNNLPLPDKRCGYCKYRAKVSGIEIEYKNR